MKMKKTQRAVSIFCTGLMLIPTLFSAQPAKADARNSYPQTYLGSEVCQVNDCTPLILEESFAKSGIQLSGLESSLKTAGIKKEPSTQPSDAKVASDTRGLLVNLTDTTALVAVTFPSLLPTPDIAQYWAIWGENLQELKSANVSMPENNVSYLSGTLGDLTPDTTYYYAFGYNHGHGIYSVAVL